MCYEKLKRLLQNGNKSGKWSLLLTKSRWESSIKKLIASSLFKSATRESYKAYAKFYNAALKNIFTFVSSLMKKFATILLICIYALATMGFSIREFYCCGKLKNISISVVSEKEKCNKGNDNSGKCCENKYQYFKVKDNHVSGTCINLPVNHFIFLHIDIASYQNSLFSSAKDAVAYKSNAPPFNRNVSLYITNCIYRIWFLPFIIAWLYARLHVFIPAKDNFK